MTSSDALNSQLFQLRDDKGIDILEQVNKQLRTAFSGKSDSLIAYLTDISKSDYIFYAGLAVVFLVLWKRLNISPSTLVGFVIAAMFIYLYIEKQRIGAADHNRDLMTELETLDALTEQKHIYIYLEPSIIRFWADNVDFRQYAKDAFDRSLKVVDLLMNLYYDVEVGSQRCSADIDVMLDLQRKVMNTWNEISFNLPNSRLIRTKFESSLERLQIILLKLLEETKNNCKAKYPTEQLGNDTTLPIPSALPLDMTDNYVLY